MLAHPERVITKNCAHSVGGSMAHGHTSSEAVARLLRSLERDAIGRHIPVGEIRGHREPPACIEPHWLLLKQAGAGVPAEFTVENRAGTVPRLRRRSVRLRKHPRDVARRVGLETVSRLNNVTALREW